jgi:hypothetical protein
MSVAMDETYLGDGLYASFDGMQIRLRAPRDGGDHYVYLDHGVYRQLQEFMRQLEQLNPGETS